MGTPVYSLTPSEAGKIKKITLTLRLRSPFLKFIEYLNRLENLHRIINVTNLKVKAKEEILPKVEIDLTLEAYAWGEVE